MKTFMLNHPNIGFGSSKDTDRADQPRALALKGLTVALLSIGMTTATPGLAATSSPASKPQLQSASSKAVQSQVDKQTADAAAEKRKQLLSDAAAAIAQTQQALKALEDKKTDVALKALTEATGKLELIVARDPSLKMAPVATQVVTFDLFADPETVKLAIADAKKALSDGDIPRARSLVEALASETQIRTTNIPLATYPTAIKAITPLIDAGKIDEAKTQLQTALNTLVVTTDVIPLPKLRVENLLKDAQALTEKKDRSKDDNDKLANELKTIREQLQMAELLGYGKKRDFQPMYAQLESIEKSSAGGKSGTNWFDKIRKQISEAF
ncbi:YfdX family protein [Undibacterium sp. Jales W-56]|uniref:YfdX family protein n=1 Tax=Undibacterium sp. Jales W-56 TaxID=2897325 RepID=UPI0021D2675F|nr:YfdX family protein [Undibacterium sp. Jales W-56]MCU6433544.1 YfdX family protein [Undibacterium sp. Jales W-56]